MGDGSRKFFGCTWIGNHSLASQFPCLYNLSSHHHALISCFANFTEGNLACDFHFSHHLFNRETDTSYHVTVLESVHLNPHFDARQVLSHFCGNLQTWVLMLEQMGTLRGTLEMQLSHMNGNVSVQSMVKFHCPYCTSLGIIYK